jgi:hypothetical protein
MQANPTVIVELFLDRSVFSLNKFNEVWRKVFGSFTVQPTMMPELCFLTIPDRDDG